MENIQIILSIAGAALGLLVTTITFLTKLIRAIKTRNKEAAKNLLTQGVIAAVQFAEQIKSKTGSALTGEAKKSIALNETKSFCAQHKIKFDEESVSEMIEEVVALTKAVNAPKGSSNLAIEGAEIK